MAFGEGSSMRDGAPAGPAGSPSQPSSASHPSSSSSFPAVTSSPYAAGGPADGLAARMRAAVKAQPGKAGVLTALLLVLGLVWVKAGPGGGGAPSAASASARRSSPSGPSSGRGGGPGEGAGVVGIAADGRGGSSRAANGTEGSAQTAQALAQQLREWTAQPLPSPPRNLFAIELVHFRRDEAASAAMAAAAPASGDVHADGFWEEVEKSLAVRADQERTRSILLENVRRQASRLELQSTVMSGSSPQALVNGTLLQEGDAIDGFRVVRIEARRIVVEREGVRLEVGFKL